MAGYRLIYGLAACVALTACKDGDADASTSTTSSGEAASESSSESGSETGTEQKVTPFRFVAMGDGGEGNTEQFAVSNAVEMVCQDAGGCDFVLYLGDNFYDDGVSSVDDMQFITKFEEPYANLDLPFWVVLGNHDYGEISNSWDKAMYELAYAETSDKFNLPAIWYDFEHKGVHFFGLDTNHLMWDRETSTQQGWLDGAVADMVAADTAAWSFAFGHHPYLSNGSHGNAGRYEGLTATIFAGLTVKEFFDQSVCGKVDGYLSGHDHNRQHFAQTCGTHFWVTGAAAKTKDFENRDDNPQLFGEDQKPGFLLVEVVDDQTLVTKFYDLDGNMDYEATVTK